MDGMIISPSSRRNAAGITGLWMTKAAKTMTGDTLLNFVNNILFPTLKNLNVTPDTTYQKSIVRTTFEDANNYMKDGVLLRQVINVIDSELDLSDYEESRIPVKYMNPSSVNCRARVPPENSIPRAVTHEFMAKKTVQPKIGERMADFACGTGGFITSWLNELAPLIQTAEDQAEYDNSIYGIEKKQFHVCCASQICYFTVWMFRKYSMITLFFAMCWTTPRMTSSTSS